MQTWREKPLPSSPPRSISIAPPSKDPHYRPRDALSPDNASSSRRLNPSKRSDGSQRPVSPPSPALQSRPHSTHPATNAHPWVPHGQSKYMMESIYRRVMNENLAMIENSGSPSPPQSAQPLLPPPLPLIAYAGSKPTSPSTDLTMPPVSRLASAPAATPIRHPAKHKLRPADAQPLVDWRKLPPTVLECVFDQLRLIHLGPRSKSCNTCHMRDINALGLTCKAFSAFATKELYSNIAIVGADSGTKLRKFKVQLGARLILLRRTLRQKVDIAALVTRLHVPDPIIPLYLTNGNPNPDYDEYLCLLASLVMACPNLELFTGFHPFYNHTFDRLTHALSTRTKLKQHVWIIAENDEVSARSQYQLPPGLLDPLQDYQFRQYHSRWSNLETLMLCSPAALGVLEHGIFVEVLHNLPNLKHLCVSSFDDDDFNDVTLTELPRLVSLRLEECKGVGDVGLAKWAASPSSILIERLSLIHQNVTSLATIAKLFSNLDRLTKFTIHQSDLAPTLPLDMVIFQPFFASKTIERIHWDIGEDIRAGMQDPDVDVKEIADYDRITPNTHLALSILHHGFPALTNLRAPRDTSPPGILQSVCRPATNADILLPADKYSTQVLNPYSKSNSLQAARLRAQRLINKAIQTRKEYVKVVVTDHTNSGLRYDAELEEEQQFCRESSKSSRDRSESTDTELTEPEVTELLQQLADEQNPGARWQRMIKEERKKNIEDLMEGGGTKRTSTFSSSAARSSSRSTSSPVPSTTSFTWRNSVTPRLQSPLPRNHYTFQRPPSPLKITEFSLPSFIGRISIHISSEGEVMFPAKPPRFYLLPDHHSSSSEEDGTLRDEMGGIAMWGQLLRVRERERVARRRRDEEKMMMEKGWGKGKGKGRGEKEGEEDVGWKDGEAEGRRVGCTGSWNAGSGHGGVGGGGQRPKTKDGKGEREEAWKHVERERVGDLFGPRGGAREVVVDDFF